MLQNAERAIPEPPRRTFAFASPYLNQPDAAFTRTADREAVFRFDFGGNQASIPLSTVAAAAELPADHGDIALLRFVKPALLYREEIAAGDEIPSELTTGRPSWSTQPATMARVVSRVVETLSSSSSGAAPETVSDAAEAVAARLIGVDPRKDRTVVARVADALRSAG